MSAPEQQAHEILTHYGMGGSQVEAFGTGLINATFLVTVAPDLQFVLQRLNPLFPPEINGDIDELTRHLAVRGAVTQRLMPADNGQLWVEANDEVWRLSTFVPGVCYDKLASEEQAREAGRLLGYFHRLVGDLDIELHGNRLGVHDTQRHLAALRTALEEHRDHRYYPAIKVLAEDVLTCADALPELPPLPDRLVHGDPKISNLVFDEATGKGVCMIDLDTLAYMPLPLEIGDAIRSWCNPKGEDEAQANFRMDFFTAAMSGYAAEAGASLVPPVWQSFVPAAHTIMVELAARFTTDALNENYFGWNPDKFADRSAHNQVRAAGQLNLHRSFLQHEAEATAAVEAAFFDPV